MATWEECNKPIEPITPPPSPSPSPSGGSGIFIVTVSLVDGTLVADKTYDEIVAAIQAGTPVFVREDNGLLPLMPFYEEDGFVKFGGVSYMEGNTISFRDISITDQNEVNAENSTVYGA